MRAIQLRTFAENDQNFPPNFSRCFGFREMIIGSYFKYLRFEKELTPRFLKNIIVKKEKSSGQVLFWKYIEQKGLKSFTGTTLKEFSDFMGYDLIFWAGTHYSNGIYPSHQIQSNIGALECHFAVPAAFRFQISDNMNFESLPKMKFLNKREPVQKIIDINNPSKTIAEWISQKSERSLQSVLNQIENVYGDRIPFDKERLFLKTFGFGFQISYRDCDANKQQTDRNTVILKKTYCDEYLNLEFDQKPPPRRFILMSDLFFQNDKVKVYSCPNQWCTLPPNSRLDVITDHLKTCTNETKYTYEAKKMTEGNAVRKFLEKNNFIPANFSQNHFCTFDIESLGVTDNAGQLTAKSSEISEQKIVTIGFSTTFGVPSKVISRNSFSHEDYISFYKEIVAHMRVMALEYAKTLPECIFESITKINAILDKDRKSESNKLDVHRKTLLERGLFYLKQITKMRIYGYNSEKYDQPLILPGILSVLKLRPSDIDVIRRGTGVMMISLTLPDFEVLYLDAYNLTAGGTLSVFAETFGAEVSKGTFPYEYFQTVDQMKACTIFPNYDAFKSSLKFPDRDNFDSKFRKAFEKARVELNLTADQYLTLMSIPHSNYESLSDDPFDLPETIDFSNVHCTLDPMIYIDNFIEYNFLKRNHFIQNMMDFLCVYNRKDCDILKQALLNYCELFKSNLNVNPLDFLTLPGMAETVLWRYFDETIGSPFSIREREINELIHKNNLGGATIIIGERHQEINVDQIDRTHAEKVYTTPNRKTITCIRSEDFNNLYGHGKRMAMPVGKAKHYKRRGDKFDWSPVTGADKYSLDSIEWINFMQSKFLKEDGSRHVIAHALNKGEVVIYDDDGEIDEDFGILKSKMYKPDGMVTVDGVDHFFEFDGCHVHQCPHRCSTYRRTLDAPNKITQRETAERNNFYRSRGQLHTITSCEWYKLKRKVNFKNYTSCFFRSKNITEKAIFEKIQSDDFFGAIVVDIETPPDVVKRFSEVGFGTIFRHMEVSESMIHQTYLSEMKSQKRAFPLDDILTLAFHAKSILITTELAKFYMDIGVNLSNISEALEFERDTPLKNFVNTVTHQRKEATRANNSALQNVFKLVANR